VTSLIVYYTIVYILLLLTQKGNVSRIIVILCWLAFLLCEELHTVIDITVGDFYLSQAILDMMWFAVFIPFLVEYCGRKKYIGLIFIFSALMNTMIFLQPEIFYILNENYRLINLALFEATLLLCIDEHQINEIVFNLKSKYKYCRDIIHSALHIDNRMSSL
tara:strand:+ start:674 stop:1159 length:486 start_codon:yes stop_codon:yes gene_type:complete